MSDMMESVIDFLGKLDTASVFGTKLVSGENLFGHQLPQTAGNAVLVTPYNTQPPDPERNAYYPSIQIRVQHESPHVAYKLCCSLSAGLHESTKVLSGAKCFAKNSAPLSLGIDGTGRTTYSVNFTFMAVNFK